MAKKGVKTYCSIPDELLERSELASIAAELFDLECKDHDEGASDLIFWARMQQRVRESGKYYENRLPMALAKDMYTLVVMYRKSRFFRFIVNTYLNFNRSK